MKPSLFEELAQAISANDNLLMNLQDVCRFQLSRRQQPVNLVNFLDSWMCACREATMSFGLQQALRDVFPEAKEFKLVGGMQVWCVVMDDKPLLLLPQDYGDKEFGVSLGKHALLLLTARSARVERNVRKTGNGLAASGSNMANYLGSVRANGSFAS